MRCLLTKETRHANPNKSMTATDLRAWQARMGYTYDTASAALGMSRAAYAVMLTGISRKTSKPMPIDRRTELACITLEAGLENEILGSGR